MKVYILAIFLFFHGTYHSIVKLIILHPSITDAKISEVIEKSEDITKQKTY